MASVILIIIGVVLLHSSWIISGNTVHVNSQNSSDNKHCMENGVCLTLNYTLSNLPSNTMVIIDTDPSLSQPCLVSD